MTSITMYEHVAALDRNKLADAILSSSLDCILVSDTQGRIVEFNPAAERTFGWPRGEVLGKTMEETIIPHQYREAHRKGMSRFLAGGAPKVAGKRIEIEALHAGGKVFPVELSITATRLDGALYFVATMRDITAQRQAAAELAEARASLQAFFDHVPVGIFINKIGEDIFDQTVEFANDNVAKPYGITASQLIGLKPYEAFADDAVIDVVRRLDQEILDTKKPVFHIMLNHHNNRYEHYTRFPILNAAGEITHIGGMNLDIDDRVRAQAQLDNARATLSAIFDSIPAALYLRDTDDTLVMMNKWGAAFLGLKPEDMIGQPMMKFREPQNVDRVHEVDQNIIKTGKPETHEFVYHLAGGDKHGLMTFFPVFNNAGAVSHIGGMLVDVTELNKAKRQLEEVQTLIQSIFDNVPVELYLRELDGTFVMMNKFGASYYDKRPEEMVGELATSYDTPDQRLVVEDAQKRLLETGNPVTEEFRYEVNGRTITAQNTIFPVRNAEGKIFRIGGISIDVTALNQARDQLQRAQENLHQSEKLAALGQLLAGVAHELNNPLAVVLGRAAILQEKLKDTPHAAPLQKLREAADRCTRIVKTFLAMARQTGPRREIVEINELIDSALEMTTYSLRKHDITWNKSIQVDREEVEVDQDQIVQVLINLILNAQQALLQKADDRKLDIRVELCPGDNTVSIAVSDNGPGVPANIVGRIFDPFFTTKSVGEGTGLGLSVCKSMVEGHGGSLKLEETPGGGATFRVVLPALLQEARAAATATELGQSRRLRGRFLVVDDEIEIAAILADCLTPLGIEGVIVSNGLSALDRVEKEKFDAVFCDVSMPGMDGLSFYDALKTKSPELAARLVFISGDVLHGNWNKLKAAGDRPVIEKPFDPQQVRDVAIRLLQGEGSNT